MFWNLETEVELIVHLDDILSTGDEEELNKLETALQKVYEVKGCVIGPGRHQKQSENYLGRTIEFVLEGTNLITDPKHMKTLMKDNGMVQCKSAPTPYITEKPILEHLAKEERELMSDKDATLHRGSVA